MTAFGNSAHREDITAANACIFRQTAATPEILPVSVSSSIHPIITSQESGMLNCLLMWLINQASHGCFIPPSAGAWRIDSTGLSALNGMRDVMFSFENRSGWGNILYLDNINIQTGPLSVPHLKGNELVKTYPNPNRGSFVISYPGFASEKARLVIYDLLGQEKESRQLENDHFELNLQVKPGMYFYSVLAENRGILIAHGNLVMQN
jgi:hypothetical protein